MIVRVATNGGICCPAIHVPIVERWEECMMSDITERLNEIENRLSKLEGIIREHFELQHGAVESIVYTEGR